MDMGKDVFAQISDDRLAKRIEKRVGKVVEDAFQQEKHNQGERDDVKHPAIFIHKDFVKQGLDHVSLHGGKAGACYHAENGAGNFPLVGLKEKEKSDDEFFFLHEIW